MFSESADIYDAIYLNMGKDYAAEARIISALAQQHKRTPGLSLLDVACGTGLHIGYLREHFQVEGLDLDEEMLKAARKKHPEIPFHHGDMTNFRLGRQFDVLTCLFSSIGYVVTAPRLQQAIQTMCGHLKPGGVLIVEPWFTPEQWHSGTVHASFVNLPELKIARMNISAERDNVSILAFEYLVGTPENIRRFTEHHELGLFTHAEYLQAFRAANLEVTHDPVGLDGRGLYLGVKA